MKKNFLKIFLTIPALAVCLAFTGCVDEASSTKQLEERIGTEFVQTIQNSKTVTAVKILPKHYRTKEEKQGYNLFPTDRPMTEQQVNTFAKLILNDDHYYFDKTKKCLFIPEMAVRVSGEKDYIIFASYSAKQLKFVDGEKETILDCDPMATLVENEFDKYVR
ncbi:MAG: hypothetical protein K940chlam3_00976 [Chlamydiae bacterium]|nr:hypothetical protein [Chlamydiota bacterium]